MRERLMIMRRRERLLSHEAQICHAACVMAEQAEAQCMIAITRSGRTPRLLSQYRTSVPILAFTEDPSTIRYLGIIWGVKALHIEKVSDTDSTLKNAARLAKELGMVEKGDTIVHATGIPLLESNATNMIKIETL